jgi:hypothetical protein
MNDFEVRTIKKDKMFGSLLFYGVYASLKQAEKKAAFLMTSPHHEEDRLLGLEIVELVPVTRKVLIEPK